MYRKRATLFLISAILLLALLYSLDWGKFSEVAGRVSLGWLLLLLCLQASIMLLNTCRWYVLVRRYGVSFVNALWASLICLMVNNLTPMSMVGGEPVRAYVLAKIDRIKAERAFATVLVDLFLGVAPVVFIDLVAISLVIRHSLDLRYAWFLALVGASTLGLLSVSVSILLRREPSMRLLKALLNLFGRARPLRAHVERLESGIDVLFMNFHNSMKVAVADRAALLLASAGSAAVWALTYLRVYLIFLALGVPVSPDVVVIVYSMLVMVSVLPLLPGALGMWEWAGIGMFALFGIGAEEAAAVVMLDRMLFYWIPILTGVASSLHVGLSARKLMEKDDLEGGKV